MRKILLLVMIISLLFGFGFSDQFFKVKNPTLFNQTDVGFLLYSNLPGVTECERIRVFDFHTNQEYKRFVYACEVNKTRIVVKIPFMKPLEEKLLRVTVSSPRSLDLDIFDVFYNDTWNINAISGSGLGATSRIFCDGGIILAEGNANFINITCRQITTFTVANGANCAGNEVRLLPFKNVSDYEGVIIVVRASSLVGCDIGADKGVGVSYIFSHNTHRIDELGYPGFFMFILGGEDGNPGILHSPEAYFLYPRPFCTNSSLPFFYADSVMIFGGLVNSSISLDTLDRVFTTGLSPNVDKNNFYVSFGGGNCFSSPLTYGGDTWITVDWLGYTKTLNTFANPIHPEELPLKVTTRVFYVNKDFKEVSLCVGDKSKPMTIFACSISNWIYENLVTTTVVFIFVFLIIYFFRRLI